MILRILQKTIQERLFKGKAILIFGSRQCGKSTLVEAVLSGSNYLHLNGDDSYVREILSNTSVEALKTIIGKNKILF